MQIEASSAFRRHCYPSNGADDIRSSRQEHSLATLPRTLTTLLLLASSAAAVAGRLQHEVGRLDAGNETPNNTPEPSARRRGRPLVLSFRAVRLVVRQEDSL